MSDEPTSSQLVNALQKWIEEHGCTPMYAPATWNLQVPLELTAVLPPDQDFFKLHPDKPAWRGLMFTVWVQCWTRYFYCHFGRN